MEKKVYVDFYLLGVRSECGVAFDSYEAAITAMDEHSDPKNGCYGIIVINNQ